MTDIFAALGLPPPNAAPVPALPPEYEAWIAQHPVAQQDAARDQANAKYAEYLTVHAGPPELTGEAEEPKPVSPGETVSEPDPAPEPPKRTRGRPPKGEALQIILAAAPGSRTIDEIRQLIALAQETSP